MAHGLEIRVPYLDQEVVEYVERLPASYKVRWGRRKWLHRHVCQRFLPKEIIRRKKIGFATPIRNWFRESMDAKIKDTLLEPHSKIYEYLAYEKVHKLVKDHQNGRQSNHKIIFSLIAFQEWLRTLSWGYKMRNNVTPETFSDSIQSGKKC
jgi:asparagine synthase (glutamine-hydrolysing)